MIVVPLLDRYADSGEPINYLKLSRALEEQVRAKGTGKFRVYIVGFGKLVGDLIEGLTTVISYFAISVAIAALFVFAYTRCLRSTVVLVVTAVLGVVWLLGLLQLLGYELDPYSILVPFLLFAIGLSHGAQKMNGIMQDVGRGTHKYVAARYTFRRLFLAGLTALLTNVVGFVVLIIIDIPVIRDLAVMTSIGVTGLIFTKLVLIPVLLSYTGVSPKAAQRSLNADAAEQAGRSAMGRVWTALERLTERRCALIAIVAAALLGAGALSLRTGLKIGDLDEGAPELRARLALQPRQRLHRAPLRPVERPVRGHREDAEERLRPLRGPGRGRPPRLGARARAGREGGDLLRRADQARGRCVERGLFQVEHAGARPAHPRPGGQPRDPGQPGRDEPELLAVRRHGLPERPPRRHARPRAEGGGGLRSDP